MSAPRTLADAARDDLAFMRSLVTGRDNFQRDFGEAYGIAGACYGVQMALHMTQAAFSWFTTPTAALLVGFTPTLVFLALMAFLVWRRRRGSAPTTANRAIGAVFQAIGLANLALAAVIGAAAWRAQSLQVWLIFPCTVFVLQGAAWLVAWHVRRRPWLGLVGAGWFATGIAMGFAIDVLPAYMALAAFGFLAFMLAPGVAMTLRRRPA